MKSFLLILSIIILTNNLYSQEVEYNMYPVSGVNGNKINDSTVVAGDVGYIAGYWDDGNVTQYPALPNYTYARVYGINKSKQMVGYNYNSWSVASRATLWENGNTIDLGVLPGFVNSRATGINSNGVIVGHSSMGDISGITIDSSMSFRIVNNNMQMINIPAGYRGSAAWDINDNNSIAGIAVYSDSSNSERLQHAAIWVNGMMSDINGSFHVSQGLSINNNNQVCGWGVTEVPPPLSYFWEAFVWSAGGLTKLGRLPGYDHSRANAINDSGIVVGTCPYGPGPEIGIIWRNNTMIDLNTLISPASGITIWNAVDINNKGQILVRARGGPNPYIDTYILKPVELTITNPLSGALFIAGEEDTIRWDNGKPDQTISFKYSLNGGSTYTEILETTNTDSGYFLWNIPDDLLSTKAMLKVIDYITGEELAESELFRIKPLIITKLDANGDYIAYDIETDRWGYENEGYDVWPGWWNSWFDYSGVDPFTGLQYDQTIGSSVFWFSAPSDFPDWESFVNTFGINACYHNTFTGEYNLTAVEKWGAKRKAHNGSCFGIAAANALLFEREAEYNAKFPNVSPFDNPINLAVPDTGDIASITELFAHQFGNPSRANDRVSYDIKTPNQTLRELRAMLKEDEVEIKTLTIFNNNGPGGHTILAYKVEQDKDDAQYSYVWVYDNSYQNLTDAIIAIDTSANSGNGFWDAAYGWDKWGGTKNIYLEIPNSNYLSNAILPKQGDLFSPFILAEGELEINNTDKASIIISDNSSNMTGYKNNLVFSDIPGSIPLNIKNGSETPPYGYHLPFENYSIKLDDFLSDSTFVYFFESNKLFKYERDDASNSQTDRLLFDGGVSVANPDQESKSIKLLNIINETTQEKLFLISSLNLAQNDSVKIVNPDENKLDLISYGTGKTYSIKLEFASELGLGRFIHNNISLSQNTTHRLIPNWGDFAALHLQILVDNGNDGTIDDTLHLEDQGTGVEEHGSNTLPTEYNLEQNYPNPFNNSTIIRYSIPEESYVSIKVYNIVGEELGTLISKKQSAGNYEVEFDAANMTSGVYFYRIQAGDFVDTKKMILLR